jgi:ATP-dependent helicase/nuclease subunit B
MTARRPRLFNIPADADFLSALAEAIWRGDLPERDGAPPAIEDLPHWTILVPTRRAARALSLAFLKGAPGGACLLPRIRPIGDIDEDLLELPTPMGSDEDSLAPAISAAGRKFLLLGIINDWAAENAHESLARDLSHSPAHRLGLADSLMRLLDSIETEGKNLFEVGALYDFELAIHRQAMVSLLGEIQIAYPRRLHEGGLLDPVARRNTLLRHQARSFIDAPPKHPVIAAGSTGSIPATAELLGTIARLAKGAVILPGLDLDMDKASWEAITPQHAQFGLKRLLDSMGADRGEVEPLPGLGPSAEGAARRWFASEIMRPAVTAAQWRKTVSAHRDDLKRATARLSLCPFRNRREEATAIAVILRGALEIPDQKAMLVTPDRDLARRVAAELRRWGVVADDSAGEPLSRTLPGRLAGLLIEMARAAFDAVSLTSLLQHPMANFGLADRLKPAFRHLELAVLRADLAPHGLASLRIAVERARAAALGDDHVHMAIRRLSPADWDAIELVCEAIEITLSPLAAAAAAGARQDLSAHVETLATALERVSASPEPGSPLWSGPAGIALGDLVSVLRRDSPLHPPCYFAEAMLAVSDQLGKKAVRPPWITSDRISILGLLEARLLHSDVVVLGGLNEGKWPSQPDPGPWINRPMRDVIGMQQPEREIGLTAHDFVQALGARRAYVTWSERIEGAPAVPSRWIVTARMLLDAAKIDRTDEDMAIANWAGMLDAPDSVTPVRKPKPTPPVEARPRRLSVTEVETLIRDPYAIYAKKVLRLEPLPALVPAARHALRGTIIHEALDIYDRLRRERGLSSLAALHEAGALVFNEYRDDPEIVNFWQPRFARIAQWFAGEDDQLRHGVASSRTEQKGAVVLAVAGTDFTLSGRADRIDLFERGTARIVDYKTGTLPSEKAVKAGLKPQLTLEAAMLERDAFGLGRSILTDELLYIRLSGGEPPGDFRMMRGAEVMTLARTHFAALKGLLEDYARPQQPYLPILAMERERDRGDFDHLSRIDEWALSGKAGK